MNHDSRYGVDAVPMTFRALRRVLTLGLLTASSVGCGLSTGFLHDPSSDQTIRYQMIIGSERYQRTVFGSSSVPSILCVLPLGGTQYQRAMQELIARATLQVNEHLANIRADNDLACFILVGSRTLTISADVYVVTPTGVAPEVVGPTPSSSSAAAQRPAPARVPSAPPDPAQYECLDDNSCRTGYHCVFTSGTNGGTCRPQAP